MAISWMLTLLLMAISLNGWFLWGVVMNRSQGSLFGNDRVVSVVDLVSAAAIGASCGELLLLASLLQKDWLKYLVGIALLYLLNVRFVSPLGKHFLAKRQVNEAEISKPVFISGPILNLLVLIGLVMTGLLSNILAAKPAVSIVVIGLSFVSPGVITYAWVKGASYSSNNAGTLGAISGFLSESCLMAFVAFVCRSFSLFPDSFWYIALASIVKMTIIGGIVGMVIDRHSRGKVGPKIVGCLVLLSLVFSFLLPCISGGCPKPSDLFSNLLILTGWGFGLLICGSTEKVFGRN